MVKYYSVLSLVLVSVAAADRKAIINLRQLQGATRPPKTRPPTAAATRPPKTPPPTPAATRLPKTPAPTEAVPETPSPTIAGPQSIAQIICSNNDFFTLCSYLEITGLYGKLNSSGTYTLFAPNNDAFEKLANVADLTDDEIMGLLMYHVAPSIRTYNNLMMIAPGDVKTMVPSLPIAVSSTGADGDVLLNGKAKITTPDIEASNGIIQVIDQVIIPPIDPPTPAPVTPEPTLIPTEAITREPTLKPTGSPIAQVDTMSPTLEPSSKPDIISKSPNQFPTPFPYGKDTPNPTIYASIIDNIGTSSPTRKKVGVFSKSGKSGSKTPKNLIGKSSKHSSKSIKYSSMSNMSYKV
ncbi:fasciclin domain-containing protein [Skeletonema marinoi]|uniref:Fasciclin domain-containing protein n=1 Tax=Skeletonema marinoi TaxID=267567 RepID=A0AAD8XTT3_9STRA|nr:fasciclin domain-containing protein [Skeletonema marinoi]